MSVPTRLVSTLSMSLSDSPVLSCSMSICHIKSSMSESRLISTSLVSFFGLAFITPPSSRSRARPARWPGAVAVAWPRCRSTNRTRSTPLPAQRQRRARGSSCVQVRVEPGTQGWGPHSPTDLDLDPAVHRDGDLTTGLGRPQDVGGHGLRLARRQHVNVFSVHVIPLPRSGFGDGEVPSTGGTSPPLPALERAGRRR